MNSCNFTILFNYTINHNNLNYSCKYTNYYSNIQLRIGAIIQYQTFSFVFPSVFSLET